VSNGQEELKELLEKDPLFAEFFDRFERSFYTPSNLWGLIGLSSQKVPFDPDQLYKKFHYAYDNGVSLDEETWLDCLLLSEHSQERLGTNLELAQEFKYDLARSFNLAIEQLKLSQHAQQPPQRTKNWREWLEGKASFTFVEAAEIAGESERSLRNKVNRPDRPGTLKVNAQGRITQKSLKEYLLAEREV